MISSAEMAVVDANAEALGVPRKQLMESSGNAVAGVVRAVADPGASVALVCGRGNNGGDAFVAARFLSEYDVTVSLLGRTATISTEIARENWTALEAAEIDAREIRDSAAFDLDAPDVVVDAMLGTGVTGGAERTRSERRECNQCDRRNGRRRRRSLGHRRRYRRIGRNRGRGRSRRHVPRSKTRASGRRCGRDGRGHRDPRGGRTVRRTW